MDKTSLELLNPTFAFTFAGTSYTLKRASLRKIILYQEKVQELTAEKKPGTDAKLLAFCIYIMLRDIDTQLTEDYVLDNVAGDTDVVDVLQTLGFMSPRQRELVEKIQDKK